MASSSSSSSSSTTTVTNEQFNLFHSIDRQLYTRLVVHLTRDPAETMQVMALWLWLERAGHCLNLVYKILSLPYTLINAMADEAVMCLTCIEQDEFPSSLEALDIPLTQNLSKLSDISLHYFHENRLSVIRGVTQIVNEVCARAFEDITRAVLENRQQFIGSNNNQPNQIAPEGNVGGAAINSQIMVPPPGTFYSSVLGIPFYGPPSTGLVPNYMGIGGVTNVAPQILPNNVGVVFDPRAAIGSSTGANSPDNSRRFDPYDLAYQRNVMNEELSELLNSVRLTVTEEEEEEINKEVPPDDRTIFLTFSKGYPISENEVKEFFARKYGDCIEAIIMQEVQPEEQVLYARLVVKSTSSIDYVLGGQSRAKFAINGKHVWARKYVKKQQQPKSPTQGGATPSSSQPDSP